MPATEIRLFREDDRSTPLMDWLAEVESRNRKAYEKCRSYLQRLSEFGRELRRPTADYLRDGVYELRIKHQNVNYRIFYGFVGPDVALVTHGSTKEKKVPPKEIDLAAERLRKYRGNPGKYGATESIEDSTPTQEVEIKTQPGENEVSKSKPKAFTFPQIAQAAMRQLADGASDKEEKQFYRRAIVSLLEPFAEILGEEAVGCYRELKPHPEVIEKNEPYDLWRLFYRIRRSQNVDDIVLKDDDIPKEWFEYFFENLDWVD
jgi:phage-related protein